MDSAEEIEVLSCTVSSVIYKNDENGYAVLKVQDEDGADRIITGTIPYAWPGETLTAYGHWVNRAGHGRQFEVESTVREEPEGSRAAFLYLSSGAVKGIGPALAGQIVTKFGDRAKTISEEYCRQVNLKKLVLLLNESGVLPEYAIRFYRFFGDRSIDMLKENPYLLTGDYFGVDFFQADALALHLGFSGDCTQRVEAAVLFELRHNLGNGHTFLPREKLALATDQLIGVGPEAVEEAISVLEDGGELIVSPVAGQNACYLAALYQAETETAARLWEMARARMGAGRAVEAMIRAAERDRGLTYAALQREAVQAAAEHHSGQRDFGSV